MSRPEGFRLSWLRLSNRTLRLALIVAAGVVLLAGLARAGASLGAGGTTGEAFSAGLKSIVFGILALAALAAFFWLVAGREPSALPSRELVLSGWLAGTLAFLNTWDLPIYLSLILAAGAWSAARERLWPAVRRAAWTGAAAVVLALAAVALWLPTFSSQAGGILPNMVFPTRLVQFLIMFVVVLLPVALWLVLRTRREIGQGGAWRGVLAIAFGLPALLWLLSWLLGAVLVALAPGEVQAAIGGLGASGVGEVAAAALARRFDAPGVALLLGFLLALAWLYLRRARAEPDPAGRPQIGVFVVLMAALGACLVIVPEFFYLRDSFGSRMNTVFKLWYAAWLLWAVAAAYILAWRWEAFGRWGRPLLVIAILPLLLGLVYTTTALWEKTSHFSVAGGPQLDGTTHLDLETPGDATAIRWMRAALTPAVIAEAVGGSYSQYGRISAHTGFPTVLGWDFHEYQWRGDWTPQGTRQDDIGRLYLTKEWEEAQEILDRYDIRYVYVGPLERSTYSPINTRKFDVYMTKLYDQGDVTIYARREQVGS